MGRVGLYVNINAPQFQKVVCSRKESRWPDDITVVCPKELTCFLPHSSCKVAVRKTGIQVFAAQLCRGKPRDYPLCVLDEGIASEFDCLKKIEDFGIVF